MIKSDRVFSSNECAKALREWAKQKFVENAPDKLPVAVVAGIAGVGKSYITADLGIYLLNGRKGRAGDGLKGHEDLRSDFGTSMHRVLNLRWSDFVKLGEHLQGSRSLVEAEQGQALDDVTIHNLLGLVATFVPEWASREEHGGLRKEAISQLRTAWLQARQGPLAQESPFEHYVFIVHDVEEAFATGEASAEWTETISVLSALHRALRQQNHGLGVVLSTRVRIWEKETPDDEDLDNWDTLEAESRSHEYLQHGCDPTLGLEPLLQSLEAVCDTSTFILAGMTDEEATQYLSKTGNWFRRLFTFADGNERVERSKKKGKILHPECVHHALLGVDTTDESILRLPVEAELLQPTNQTRRGYTYYSPLEMEAAWIIDAAGVDNTNDRLPELLESPLRDGVPRQDVFNRAYYLALKKCLSADPDGNRVRTLLLVLLLSGTRSRSSGWLKQDLDRLSIGGASSPPGVDVIQAERRARQNDNPEQQDEFDRWASILMLNLRYRILTPYRSFFELDLLTETNFKAFKEDAKVSLLQLKDSLQAGSDAMWLPRHPTVRDFGIALSLYLNAAQCRPDLGPDSEADVVLVEAWRDVQDGVLAANDVPPKPFERVGAKALCGQVPTAREVALALSTEEAQAFPSLLTAFFASVLEIYSTVFEKDVSQESWLYPYFDLSDARVSEGDDTRPYLLSPDRTFIAAQFVERAYQDLDLWETAQEMCEGLRSVCIDIDHDADTAVRLRRHRAFFQVMHGLLLGENDGDYVGGLQTLLPINVEDPAVLAAKETASAIHWQGFGNFAEAAVNWSKVIQYLEDIKKETKDFDLGYLEADDRRWIDGEIISAQLNRMCLGARIDNQPLEIVPGEGSVTVRQGTGDDRLVVTVNLSDYVGQRGIVYAIAEVAYVYSQQLLSGQGELEGLWRLMTLLKAHADTFAGDPWIHHIIDVLDTQCTAWFADPADAEARLARASQWALETLRDPETPDEPHYTELIIEMQREYLSVLAGEHETMETIRRVMRIFVNHDVWIDAHWFGRVFAYLYRAMPANPTLQSLGLEDGDLLSVVERFVAWLIVSRIRGLRVMANAGEKTMSVLKLRRSLLVLSQFLAADENRLEEQLERTDHWDAWRNLMGALAERLSGQEVEVVVPDVLSEEGMEDLMGAVLKRIDFLASRDYALEKSVLESISHNGDRELVPPILIPELAVYRSMPSYLSRL